LRSSKIPGTNPTKPYPDTFVVVFVSPPGQIRG